MQHGVENCQVKVDPPAWGRTPGFLQGEVSLSLHTGQAQRLVSGRKAQHGKAAIMGLLGFAGRVRIIDDQARRDNPFADWWLLKLHKQIVESIELLESRRLELSTFMEKQPLSVHTAQSREPLLVPLRFRSAYAFFAAEMVAKYDELACLLLSASHAARIERSICETLLVKGARTVRRAFYIVQGYRDDLMITRTQCRQDNPLYREVSNAMGHLPEAVKLRKLRAPFAPGIGIDQD